jgi:hypothetical protein
MKTPEKYVQQMLKELVKKFPQARARHEFRECANAHFIEILPYELYSASEEYISWELAMWDKFTALYPWEGICFISSDALVGVENAELVLYGAACRPAAGKAPRPSRAWTERLLPQKARKEAATAGL